VYSTGLKIWKFGLAQDVIAQQVINMVREENYGRNRISERPRCYGNDNRRSHPQPPDRYNPGLFAFEWLKGETQKIIASIGASNVKHLIRKTIPMGPFHASIFMSQL